MGHDMEALVWETAEELDKNWQNVCAVFADGGKFRNRNFRI